MKRDSRDPKDREYKDGKDFRNLKDSRDSRELRDNRDRIDMREKELRGEFCATKDRTPQKPQEKKLAKKNEQQPIVTPVILGAKSITPKLPDDGNAIEGNYLRELLGTNVQFASSEQNRQQTSVAGKFLNETLEFTGESLIKMFSEQEGEFTVIGVIGNEGVGKSTLLSLLYQHQNFEQTTTTPFPSQSEDNLLSGTHQTSGIDLCMNSNRTIFLDCQPMNSPSILSQLLKNSKSNLLPEFLSFENFHDIQCLQLATFMFSICHIVLIVQDWIGDLEFWKFIRAIEMLKYGIPDPSSVGLSTNTNPSTDDVKTEPEFVPTIVLVFNKIHIDQASTPITEKLQEALDKFFPKTLQSKDANGENHINYLILPLNEKIYPASDRVNAFGDSFQVSVEKFRQHIFGLKKNVFARTISETQWLRNSSKIWNLIRNSSFIADYNKILQKTQLYRV